MTQDARNDAMNKGQDARELTMGREMVDDSRAETMHGSRHVERMGDRVIEASQAITY